MNELEPLRAAKKSIQSRHYPNVKGISIGYKFRNGKRTEEIAVVVYVSKKIPEIELLAEHVIPKTISALGYEVKTDVIQSRFSALTLIDKEGPVKPGYSVSHPNVSAGTLSFFAEINNQIVIVSVNDLMVSNAHILSDTNKGKIGDPIYYPGTADGGTEENTVAHLAATIPIEMIDDNECPIANLYVNGFNFLAKLLGRKSRIPRPVREVFNRVDCACARMVDGIEIDKNIYKIGAPVGIREPALGLGVQKSGRTTEYTAGQIIGIEATVQVTYSQGAAWFDGQIISDIPSAGGDSGSAVLAYDNNLVGLLFAGGEGITIMNPIEDVFQELGLEI